MAKLDHVHTSCLYAELQAHLKRYHDLELIVKRWERERVFDCKGLRDMLDSLATFQSLDEAFSALLSKIPKEENCELLASFRAIDRPKLSTLQSLIINSLDLGGKAKISIKSEVFAELDALRRRYEDLDVLMTEKLQSLRDDIKQMPLFMRKMKMMMIPGIGYFTVACKSERAYIDFLNESLPEELADCKDEDHILECLLGETLQRLGWKICFLSETEVFLKNRVTAELDQTEGDLFT